MTQPHPNKVLLTQLQQKELHTLEYDKIIAQLQQLTQTAIGNAHAAALLPSADKQTVQTAIEQTDEAVSLLRVAQGLALPKLSTVKQAVKRLEIDASLNAKELANVMQALKTTQALSHFITTTASKYQLALPELKKIIAQLVFLPEVCKRLTQALASDGTILETASSKLKAIKNNQAKTQAEIRSQLASLTHGKTAKYLTNTNITMRQDRYVVAVASEHKNKIAGIVHDQSASGQTLFIEPTTVVSLNNRLNELKVAERSEIKRILAELSGLLMPYTNDLVHNERHLAQLDFINAKARLAQQLHATKPIIDDENNINLRHAWHPLLAFDQAIKNTITLGNDTTTIVITGPNTGGKTITLKTLALNQAMAQAGLFVCASDDSSVGVFDQIFADIGDEQSLEQSLSTFSSHIVHINTILRQATAKSLVVLDEVGAGTDPKEGAILAMSILDELRRRRIYTLASTHYPELKAYGFASEHVINASMEFDLTTLKPTYRLLLGVPGQSNALAIAKRLGMPETVIHHAQQLTPEHSQTLNAMIADLVEQKRIAHQHRVALAEQLKKAEQLHHDLQVAYNDITAQKTQLLEQAKAKANAIVQTTTKQADEVIANLRMQAKNASNVVDEGKIIAAKTTLNQLEQPRNLAKNKVLKRAKAKAQLKENDDVFIPEYGQHGILVKKLSGENWEVQVGMLKLKLNAAQLEKKQPAAEPKAATKPRVKKTRSAAVSAKLDLRGVRYEEAMHQVEQYLDEAVLANLPSVTIIHGKGTGVIRQGVRQLLQRTRTVKDFEYAAPNAGGNGATIVYFK